MDLLFELSGIPRKLGLPFVLFSALWLNGVIWAQAAETPDLPLANVYRKGVDVSQYWVSEKLDGVRAYWNGSFFISRNGRRYFSPPWFTAGFPKVPLDGELWMGRGSFQQLVSVVRTQQPNDQDWRRIRYMVFDLPSGHAGFTQRLEQLESLVQQVNSRYIKLVEQVRVTDHVGLMKQLAEVVEAGGEGLMLHHGAALYRAGRSDGLLKLKPYMDAEARVIAHLPGQGKYTGMLGALLVESVDGKRFRIGSGLRDADRRMPPAIGSLITCQYRGFTDSGIPRFASYLRVREE